MDIIKDIRKETNVDYLTQLDKFIDMDIENIGKNNLINEKVALMNGMTLEEYNEKQLIRFKELKSEVQKRIEKLTK
jgi:hypothetical protein